MPKNFTGDTPNGNNPTTQRGPKGVPRGSIKKSKAELAELAEKNRKVMKDKEREKRNAELAGKFPEKVVDGGRALLSDSLFVLMDKHKSPEFNPDNPDMLSDSYIRDARAKLHPVTPEFVELFRERVKSKDVDTAVAAVKEAIEKHLETVGPYTADHGLLLLMLAEGEHLLGNSSTALRLSRAARAIVRTSVPQCENALRLINGNVHALGSSEIKYRSKLNEIETILAALAQQKP
jgi:hypothetical protein